VYRLKEPITFTPADSGTELYPVTYKAEEGLKVILTGAQTLTPDWKRWKDGIYRTKVGEENTIDQLIVNNRRQIMARYRKLVEFVTPTEFIS
jgi:hypothetical protein|tara:strand:+ start:2974 stop:3249 length:276 start_codon:yes stop_codon:yes gene_type:complete